MAAASDAGRSSSAALADGAWALAGLLASLGYLFAASAGLRAAAAGAPGVATVPEALPWWLLGGATALLLAQPGWLTWRWGWSAMPESLAVSVMGRVGGAYRACALVGAMTTSAHLWVRWHARGFVPESDLIWLSAWLGQPIVAALACLGVSALAFHAGASLLWLCDRAWRAPRVRKLRLALACTLGIAVWVTSLDAVARLATGAGVF